MWEKLINMTREQIRQTLYWFQPMARYKLWLNNLITHQATATPRQLPLAKGQRKCWPEAKLMRLASHSPWGPSVSDFSSFSPTDTLLHPPALSSHGPHTPQPQTALPLYFLPHKCPKFSSCGYVGNKSSFGCKSWLLSFLACCTLGKMNLVQ